MRNISENSQWHLLPEASACVFGIVKSGSQEWRFKFISFPCLNLCHIRIKFATVRMLKTVPQWRTAGACLTLVFGVIRGWPFARQDWM